MSEQGVTVAVSKEKNLVRSGTYSSNAGDWQRRKRKVLVCYLPDLQGILAARSPKWSTGDDSHVVGLRLRCGFLHNELSDLWNWWDIIWQLCVTLTVVRKRYRNLWFAFLGHSSLWKASNHLHKRTKVIFLGKDANSVELRPLPTPTSAWDKVRHPGIGRKTVSQRHRVTVWNANILVNNP